MGSAFHQLCPRYSGTLTPTAPMANRLWETFTFFSPFSYSREGETTSYSRINLVLVYWSLVPVMWMKNPFEQHCNIIQLSKYSTSTLPPPPPPHSKTKQNKKKMYFLEFIKLTCFCPTLFLASSSHILMSPDNNFSDNVLLVSSVTNGSSGYLAGNWRIRFNCF